MKVFISWSGERSRLVAELLNSWLKCVVQAVEPWTSSEDLEKGTIWFSKIKNQLDNTDHGIVCLTKENLTKPWILFEAGALIKGINHDKLYTLLIDLNVGNIDDPLRQFNHTKPIKSDLKKLLTSINEGLTDKALDPHTFEAVFDTYWPKFKKDFDDILKNTEEGPEPEVISSDDKLDRIYNAVRGLNNRLLNLERKSISNNPMGIPGYDFQRAFRIEQYVQDRINIGDNKDEIISSLIEMGIDKIEIDKVKKQFYPYKRHIYSKRKSDHRLSQSDDK